MRRGKNAEAVKDLQTRADQPLNPILADPTQEDGQEDLLTAEVIDPESPSDDEIPWTVDLSEMKQRIAVMTDHKVEFPDLWLNVYIAAGNKMDEIGFARMFSRAACKQAKTLDEADLVVFTGSSSDIDPQLYGVRRHKSTIIDSHRDNENIAIYLDCLEKGIPMFGVCWGAQFLHVMNRGKLYQDVDNHYGDHSMLDVVTTEIIEKISSVHHQSCMSNRSNGMQILGTASRSRLRAIDDRKTDKGVHPDIEAFFYRDTCCLGVQGHPEYQGYNYYTAWCLKQIDKYMVLNPDVDWEKVKVDIDGLEEELTLRRIIPALREQRKALVMAAAEKACS
jgi:gamma-glutamyl-gamma-aminobutyrate hydrolase PuuD